MTIHLIILTVLYVGILIAALMAVMHPDLLVNIISSGLVGLQASILYLLLSAPDVALTEPAIGSGLTTFIFLYAFQRVRSESQEGEQHV